MPQRRHRFPIYFLFFLHFFLGVNGSAGGLLLVIKPDGSLLGMQSGWLDHSPFKDYLIPGLLLLIFLGILPLLTLSGLARIKNRVRTNKFNIYRNRNWAWAYSLYTGITAIIWITVQLILAGYFWIQPVIIFNGLLIIIFTLLPGVMKHYESAAV